MMVRIGLGFKLFMALLAAGIVMAVAMGIANRISFQRGFIGYLNELETKRLEVLTGILADHWREVGDPEVGWGNLRGRDDLWRHVVRYSGYRVYSGPRALKGFSLQGLPLPPSPRRHLPGTVCQQLAREVVPGEASAALGPSSSWKWMSADDAVQAVWAPPLRSLEAGERPVVQESARLGLLDDLDDIDPLVEMQEVGRDDARIKPPVQPGTTPHSHHPPPWEPEPGGPHQPPMDAAARMTLQDAKGMFVVGNPTPGDDAIYVPVLVDGETAGWVASTPFTEVTDAADLSFQKRQETAAWFIAGLAVLLAGLMTWALARVWLVPARRLAAATRGLAEGNYEIRVPVCSRDELGQLARMFNRLASTLQHNERMRRSLMADVSHELRTPLSIMRGELEAVEDGLQPLDQRVVESLQAEVGILSKLIDDIHQLSLAEVGPLSYQWQPLDLGVLLEQSLQGWRERLGTHGLSLKSPGVVDKINISGDPDRLRQVFQNLLENSARYVDRGGTVEVGSHREGLNAVITFDDSGPGMPEADYERLFDRFYRREASRNRATGGSGLGLAICRGIVEAHGGRIKAMGSPSGGLRIRIELPLDVPSGGNV
ncbi:MAG: ATP-binding protein [Lautropia sp.]|nr:ATP-binding protein [Lautropia sp.]